MDFSSPEASRLQIFKRQYLQLVDPKELKWPPDELLRKSYVQSWLYENLFHHALLQYLPSERYQRRVLKQLFERIENAVQNPEEDEISDDLSSALTLLMSKNLPSEAVAAQKPSYVTYTFSSNAQEPTPAITLLEARSVLMGAGTTGLRTWEVALHLSNYLLLNSKTLVQGKRILELGAGTGVLSILCAGWLGAEHVVATDGDDGVVEALETNIFLNNLQENGKIDARSLKWGGTLDDGEGGEQPWYDLVLGADITYDTSSVPLLISTLRELFTINQHVDVLIGMAIRNTATSSAFLQACARNNFDVTDVDFAIRPQEEQLGPFYSTSAPIRIIRISIETPLADPFAI